MGVRKIYQSLEFKSLDTYEMVNGVRTLIQFRSGSLATSAKGQFTATSPALIEAMDHSSSNGITFKEIYTEKFDDAEEEIPAGLPKVLTAEEELLAAEEAAAVAAAADAAITKISEISTVQAARAYLVEKFAMQISKLPNAVAVRKAAAEHKIEFVDLP